jgi:uncharacterized membrane protein
MEQPKIKIEYEPADWIIEIAGAIGIILLLGIPAYFYNHLPEIVPQHFNAQGEVDGYGSKSFIWILPAIGLVSYFGLFWLNKYPHIFNYPTKITAENAHRQYKYATRFIRFLNVTIVWLFYYITYSMIQSALGFQSGPGTYFIAVFLLLIFAPIGFYIIKSVKAK